MLSLHKLAFPQYKGLPPGISQGTERRAVSLYVSFELFDPVFVPRDVGQCAALVDVPEASMHKNHLASRAENEIWLSGKFRFVHSVAISQRVNDAPDAKFRLSIRTANSTHYLRTFFLGEVIQVPYSLAQDTPMGCRLPQSVRFSGCGF